jgi:hypothetical protein
MRKSRINFISWVIVFLVVSSPLAGEKISFKISYNTASVSKGDLNTWIDSYNVRWKDLQSEENGQLDGQLNPLKYGPKYEVELRIPLFLGLAFNLCGSHFKSMEEGTINYAWSTANMDEKDFLKNEVQGIPIKIGFSYSQVLPFSENLYLFAGVGRHITFFTYKFIRDYDLRDGPYKYNLKVDSSYNSEALGFYATLGVEYDLIKHIAIVVEAEKVWSKADGFKGPLNEELTETNPGEETKISYENYDKASLYFYEYKRGSNDKYYSSFRGLGTRPDNPEDYPIYPRGITDIKNLRQGELDLSTLSFKIGIRFKF